MVRTSAIYAHFDAWCRWTIKQPARNAIVSSSLFASRYREQWNYITGIKLVQARSNNPLIEHVDPRVLTSLQKNQILTSENCCLC